jgi:predicted  nucleic acid-binding Zn-ribbon protein
MLKTQEKSIEQFKNQLEQLQNELRAIKTKYSDKKQIIHELKQRKCQLETDLDLSI